MDGTYDCMTTPGRPQRLDRTATESLYRTAPVDALLHTMVALLIDEISAGSSSAQLRRYVDPLTRCLDLVRTLGHQAEAAREAVDRVQAQQMTDLATGALMARLGCDPATARKELLTRSDSAGLDAATLTPEQVQTLLGSVGLAGTALARLRGPEQAQPPEPSEGSGG